MDTNWRPTPSQGPVGGGGGGEPTMDNGDWRAQLQPDSRQRIVNKIMDTLKRHLPINGQDGLHELKKVAIRFEEKIYTAATCQGDYLRKISLKMLTMETKSQNPPANSLPSNPSGNSNKAPDTGLLGMQLLPQNIQNNIPSAGFQNAASLPSALPPVSGLNQNPIQNGVGQTINMQSISGSSQNSVGNPMGQGVPSNMFANNPRQMQGRQSVVPLQQQQSQNEQQYLYLQQLHQHLLKEKIQQWQQQGAITHSLMQSHIQQQKQQNLLHPNQLQSSQQSLMQTAYAMQPSVMQSSSLPGIQQNQQPSIQQTTPSMLQQHPQSVLRQQQQPQQAAVVHQQQTSMQQQTILPSQQHQMMLQQPNATNMQQNQLIAQQGSVRDMQQQQQQQRLISQQNNLQNMRQQLMAQQNHLSNMHQQQLGSESNVSGLQQQPQQMLGSRSVYSSMQATQHSVHTLQQPKVPLQQQPQRSASNLVPNQGQPSQSQSQPQPSQQHQQQMMSHIQSQPLQLQQLLGLQQQPTSLQRDMHQRLQASGSLLQQQNVIDQQKQLYYRAVPDTSSTSLDSTAQTGHPTGGDWQEEIYQKIKAMKEMYLPELNEMYHKIAMKLQQHDSLPQQPKSDPLKLEMFKNMLELIMTFLQISKSNVLPGHKDKLGPYEKQILNFINTNRSRKPVSSLQQGQLPPPQMHSMQQPQSQIPQMQSHENQMNPQLQAMNLQGSVATMQQNNMTSLQHNSLSTLSGGSTAQQNMMNSLQPGSSLDSGQGNSLCSLQPVAMGYFQQNPVSAPQQPNINTLSSLSGVNVLQPNINPHQSNSNMLQQQMMQTLQLKQHIQQRQMQQQLMQKQQMMQQQQLHQQPKQLLTSQLQNHQIPELHQINEISEHHCPRLRRSSYWIYVGLLMVSVAVMLSLILWPVYARESGTRVLPRREFH